jgi:1-acyl-sn-glycerol-3-phosphate acyltransferase
MKNATSLAKFEAPTQRLRQVYKGGLVAGLFLWGMAATGVIWPLSTLLLGRRAGACQERIRRHWCGSVCRILNVQMEILGDPSPDTRLWVANHISWLDIIALGSRHPLLFVAKAEVASWPVMGFLARRLGTLFVRRGDAEQTAGIAEQMAWQLRQGRQLMLFPEGTTTRGDRVLRFHAKLLGPAHLTHTAVQAIALEYVGDARVTAPFVGDDGFLPHLLSVLAMEGIALRIRYCPPPPVGLPRDALAHTLRRQVVEALSAKTASPCVLTKNMA